MEHTENQTLADLAVANAIPRCAEEGAVPFVVVPEGYSVETLDRTLQAPTRASGTIRVRDAASLIEMVTRYGSNATSIYYTTEPPAFEAVLNDDTPLALGGGPGWADHRVLYACPQSTEWKAWTGKNKVAMSQPDFAQFVEDNLPDMVEPAAAAMLEISRTLQAKKKVNFASAIRLDNGQHQFTYEEQVAGSAGAKGQLQVPEVFKIGIPVFEGGDRYAVRARLRYRISDQGALALWFDLERPHKILEDAVAQLVQMVAEGTGRKLINGTR